MDTDNDVDLGRGLLLACNDGDIDKVQYYIEEKHVSPTWNKKSILDPKEIHVAQNRGISGIHLAAWRNHVDVLQYLIDQGADVNLRQCYGATPLHYAAWGECKEAVQFLLTNFPDRLDYKIQDSQGRTALHDCVDIGNLEILSILYEHIKQCNDRRWMKEVADVDGNTLLHHAIVTPNKKDELREKIVDFLLKKQFHLKKKNKYGNTPLTEACLTGRYNIVCQFSDHYRRNLQSEEGFQLDLIEALLTCARNGKTAMVQKLIEGMKMPITSSNAFKETVFHKAVEGGCLDTIKFLVNYVKSHQIPYLVQVKAEGQRQTHLSNEVQIRSSFHTLATILNLRDAEGMECDIAIDEVADRNVFHYAVAKNAKTNAIKKKVLDYLLQEGCEKPQNNEAIWQDVERHCSKELVKWLSQRSEQPVKNEDSKKRKMQQAAKLHEKQQAAKQFVEAIRSLPFSKRRKTLNSKLAEEELPTLDEFTALQDKVGTMTTTIQSLESKISLLTQELELCKHTFFSMGPLQIPASAIVAQQEMVEADDLDFSNALFP